MSSESMLCLYNLETPMRDGTILRGDLYRPAEDGCWPQRLDCSWNLLSPAP